MLKKYSYSGLVIFLFLILQNFSQAQTVNDAIRLGTPGLGYNARSLGMGNAYLGLSDDGSAAFFNPAGLGLIKKIEFGAGLEFNNAGNDVTFMGAQTSSNLSSGRLNRINLVLPFPTIKGSLVFEIGYNSIKDFSGTMKFDGYNSGNTSWIQSYTGNDLLYELGLTYPGFSGKDTTIFNGHLNQSGKITTKGSLDAWSFSGAIEVEKNLFVGANINLLTGSLETKNEYYEDDFNGYYANRLADPSEPKTKSFQTFYLSRNTKWDLTGFDAKLGLIYQIQKYGRVGLTIQLPKSIKIKEDFNVDASADFANFTYAINPDKYSDKVEYTITTPLELAAGFSANYMGLILSGDATYIDYSTMEYSDPSGITQSSLDKTNGKIQDQLRSVVNLNAGLEYTIPQAGLRLRSGFMYQPSAFKDDPTKFDKKYITAGIGFITQGAFGIDFAYVHGWWSDYGDNYDSNVSRTLQEVKYNKFVLTGSFRF